MGADDEELARFFDVPPATLQEWLASVPEFAAAVLAGRALADADVADRLWRRAIGYALVWSFMIRSFWGLLIMAAMAVTHVIEHRVSDLVPQLATPAKAQMRSADRSKCLLLGGGFHRSAQHLLILLDQGVAHGDITDMVHGSAEGGAVGALEEWVKCCSDLTGIGSEEQDWRSANCDAPWRHRAGAAPKSFGSAQA